MTRTEIVINDLALALAALGPNVRNREQIFIKSLESLARYAISEHQTASIREAQNDLARVSEIFSQCKAST